MNKYRYVSTVLLFIVLLPLAGIATAFHNIPENLSTQKSELIQYHDSGRYYNDISNVTQRALYYLKFRINQNKRLLNPRKLAIVLDVDETALSNYDDMRHLDFGGTEHNKEILEADADDPAIPYTRVLYNFAKENGIAIFFITGRREHLRTPTTENLTEAGYSKWAQLIMKPETYDEKSIIPYKIAMRKKVIKMGYDIVLNIGDQESDLKGGFADMTFKIPDPFYLIS